MTEFLRRWCSGLAAMLDARALRGALGDRAAAEARRRIVAGAADASLRDLRHWTSVWSELMRVPEETRLAR